MPRASDLTSLDELINRLVRSVRRPSYRARVLRGVDRIPGAEALRVLRSIEVRERGDLPASVTHVAADLEVEQSTASRAVYGVAERGLVERTPDPTDARRMLLSLTEDGHTALNRATDNRLELVTGLADQLSAGELRELVRLLSALVEGYEALE